jgi:hypothetical protein
VLVHNAGLCDDALRNLLGNDAAIVIGRDMHNRVRPVRDNLRQIVDGQISTYRARDLEQYRRNLPRDARLSEETVQLTV